jgi:hypothetical protein
MVRPAGIANAASRWLRSLAVVIATVAQIVVAAAPLAEASVDRSTSAHVEAGGVTAHYAHNEAACAACQARSILGSLARRPFEPPTRLQVQVAAYDVIRRPVPATLHSQAKPRAPPAVI